MTLEELKWKLEGFGPEYKQVEVKLIVNDLGLPLKSVRFYVDEDGTKTVDPDSEFQLRRCQCGIDQE